MCGSVVLLGVMSYLGEMNGFRVPRLLVCTVSDSEAVIHLAHVQHLWQSKTFCYLPSLSQVED